MLNVSERDFINGTYLLESDMHIVLSLFEVIMSKNPIGPFFIQVPRGRQWKHTS